MENIFCPVCGEKQSISDTSDSFVCAQCGSTHLISTDGELRTIRFEAAQFARADSGLKKWTAGIQALFSGRTAPIPEETGETAEEPAPGRASNIALIVLSTAVAISLIFLSIIIIREVQAKRSAPAEASELVNLPRYDPNIYQTPSRTAIPSWTITPTVVFTPSSTPIFASVKSLTLNLRSGPGVGYTILKELQMADTLSLIARNELNNWIMVKTSEGDMGWVSAFLVEHDYDLSKLEVAYDIFTIPVTGATQTTAFTQTAVTAAEPTGTLTQTDTNMPSLTQTPSATHTPAVTQTPTPHQTTRPIGGEWCEQNAVRKICAYEIAYYIETLDDPSGPTSIHYAVIDVSVENLASYDILVDPYNFILTLEDGIFSFLFDDPEALFEDIDALEFTSIAPGESTRGTLRFIVPENNLPEVLTYQGYLYESLIAIEFNNVP